MRIKEYFLTIVAGLLCVVMTAVLIALFFMNHVRNAERTENLKKQAEEIERQEAQRKEDAADLYDDLSADLIMRDLVCWGDNEMAGNGDFSLPKALRDVANKNLFTDVTTEFSNAMDKEADPALSVTVNNMGVKREGMREILVRAGVNELHVGKWMVLPSDTDPHNIELKDDTSWSPLHFAQQSEVRFGSVDIDGITGTFTVGDGEYDEDHPIFAFVRDEEGDSATFGAGTQIEIASATDYIGDIPVFFFEDDSADSVSDFVEDLERLVERYTEFDANADDEEEDADTESNGEDEEAENDAAEGSTQTEAAAESATAEETEIAQESEPAVNRAFVVICTAEEDSDLDEALREAFGDRYIRSDTYAYEMTEDSYVKLAEKVYENLDSQGCFDDVKRQTEAAAEQLRNL